jgi:hypothetical protein
MTNQLCCFIARPFSEGETPQSSKSLDFSSGVAISPQPHSNWGSRRLPSVSAVGSVERAGKAGEKMSCGRRPHLGRRKTFGNAFRPTPTAAPQSVNRSARSVRDVAGKARSKKVACVRR